MTQFTKQEPVAETKPAVCVINLCYIYYCLVKYSISVKSCFYCIYSSNSFILCSISFSILILLVGSFDL